MTLDPEVSDEVQPVSLLLLDINMPIMHGLECSKAVSDLYKKVNTQRKRLKKPPLIQPLTCFMTQTPFNMIGSLIR